MSYVLMLDLVERFALTVIQAATIARALGRDVEVPSLFGMRDDFLEALGAEPKRVDLKKLQMLQAIGLRE